jgi:DNA-binding transcriptional LysR family regulator
MTMDAGLRHLKHLVAAEQHGSFRRAAEALNIRQSTLSRGIKQFEDGLGVPLFVRSTGGVRPTPAGSEFIETAKRLLADFEASVSTARALGRGSIGRLALGLAASRVSFALHGLLRDYAHEFSDVTIQLVVKSRLALLSDLDVGKVDLAIVGGSITRRDYESLSLWPERIVIAAPQDHPIAKKPFVLWKDLADEALLMSCHGFGPELKKMMTANATETGSCLRMEEHAADDEALLSLVAAGRGLVLLSSGAVRKGNPDLAYLELRDTMGTNWITFYACWKKEHNNPALASFLGMLRAHRSMVSSVPVPDT